jgi:hypothetical protein
MYTDMSPLTSIGGYKVYYGTSTRHYTSVIDVGNANTFTLPALQPGTYYLAVSVYDGYGTESSLSNEVSKTSGSGAANYTLGIFAGGTWYLDEDNDSVWSGTPYDGLFADFRKSLPGAISVTGDWNNSGTTKVGVYADGYWYLDRNGNGVWDGTSTDRLFNFGFPGATPVTGDWTGNGTTKVGVYVDGYWYLDRNGNGVWDGTSADRLFNFGFPGAIPVTGDWTGNGITKIGVYVDGYWYLDINGNGVWDGEPTDEIVLFGFAGALPVTGDWNNSGTSKVGVYADGYWYLDMNANGVWDGPQTDLSVHFGFTGAIPVVR